MAPPWKIFEAQRGKSPAPGHTGSEICLRRQGLSHRVVLPQRNVTVVLFLTVAPPFTPSIEGFEEPAQSTLAPGRGNGVAIEMCVVHSPEGAGPRCACTESEAAAILSSPAP